LGLAAYHGNTGEDALKSMKKGRPSMKKKTGKQAPAKGSMEL